MKSVQSVFITFLILFFISSCGNGEDEKEKEKVLTCAQNSECGEGQKCEYPFCVKMCEIDTQCESGEICTPSKHGPSLNHCEETPTCKQLETQYNQEADNYPISCVDDSDCKWIDGDCNDGIGGCFYAAGKGVLSTLEEIKATYMEKRCSLGGGCLCAAKTAFQCVKNLCVHDPFD